MEKNNEFLEFMYKANSNNSANKLRTEVELGFQLFKKEVLEYIEENHLLKDDKEYRYFFKENNSNTDLENFLLSFDLENELKSNIAEKVKEQMKDEPREIMERYNNYSLVNYNIIKNEEVDTHKITKDDIAKALTTEYEIGIFSLKNDILREIKKDEIDGEKNISFKDWEDIKNKNDERISFSEFLIDKYEKEIERTGKNIENKEKEMGL